MRCSAISTINLIVLLFIARPAWSDMPVYDELQKHLWQNRQVIAFSPTQGNYLYAELTRSINSSRFDTEDRNLIFWHVINDKPHVIINRKSTPLTPVEVQKTFSADPSTFTLLLIGYDGEVKKRQYSADLQPMFDAIDQMPIRQMEMQQ